MPSDTEAEGTTNKPAIDRSTKPSVDRTNVKVPPFWPEKPSLWFAQLEGQFVLNGIKNDATKYYYVSANLDNRYAMEVEDILLNPPSEGKYESLKAELIKRLSTSQEQKIKRLLEHEEIGDRTPSQFLRHLRTLAGSVVPDDFLKTLWASRLPSNMQAILATQTGTDLNAIATLADKIHETTPSMQVASTSGDAHSSVMVLTDRIDALTRQVAELTRGRQSNRRSNSRHRPRSASRPNICWYHRRFKENARKCNEPCTFSSQKNLDRGQ